METEKRMREIRDGSRRFLGGVVSRVNPAAAGLLIDLVRTPEEERYEIVNSEDGEVLHARRRRDVEPELMHRYARSLICLEDLAFVVDLIEDAGSESLAVSPAMLDMLEDFLSRAAAPARALAGQTKS